MSDEGFRTDNRVYTTGVNFSCGPAYKSYLIVGSLKFAQLTAIPNWWHRFWLKLFFDFRFERIE